LVFSGCREASKNSRCSLAEIVCGKYRGILLLCGVLRHVPHIDQVRAERQLGACFSMIPNGSTHVVRAF
jgi:hypothetical protein